MTIRLLCILLVAFALRVSLLNDITIDHDEEDVYRRFLSDETWWSIINGEARLNHHIPALLWAKLAMATFGNTLLSLRWPSFLMSMLSIALIYRLASWVFNSQVGWIAATLAVFNPYLLNYTTNFRGYCAMMFYILLAYTLTLHLRRQIQIKLVILIIIVMAVAQFNHLYATLAWFGLWWILLAEKGYQQRQRWFLLIGMTSSTMVLTGLFLLPNLLKLLTRTDIAIEIQRPSSPSTLASTLARFSNYQLDKLNLESPLTACILISLVLVASLVLLWGYPTSPRNGHILAWFYLPLVIYHLGHLFVLPQVLSRPRYFTFVAPFFVILLAYAIEQMSQFTIRWLPEKAQKLSGTYGLLLQTFFIGVIFVLWLNPFQAKLADDATGNWFAVAKYLKTELKPTDLLLCEAYQHNWWEVDYNDVNTNCLRNLQYWLDALDIPHIYPVDGLGVVTDPLQLQAVNPVHFQQISGVWLVLSDVPSDQPMPQAALDQFNRLGRTVIFPPPAKAALPAVSQHLHTLNDITPAADMQALHLLRLGQLAIFQGQQSQAEQAWLELERHRPHVSPELEWYIQEQLPTDKH